MVTACPECEDDEMAELGKFAVQEVTADWGESGAWALQHIRSVRTKVVPGRYVVYNLALYMAESTCTRGVVNVYSESCSITRTAPTNYCEVTPPISRTHEWSSF